MAYSEAIAGTLRDVFEQTHVRYETKETNDAVIFTFGMKMNGKLQSVRVVALVRENDFSVLATSPISADEDSRLAVAEYLTRVNYNMRNGNFELDMNSGDVRFKTYVHVGDGRLSVETARLAVLIPLMMFDRYGDGLLEVLFGYKSPREAYEAVGK